MNKELESDLELKIKKIFKLRKESEEYKNYKNSNQDYAILILLLISSLGFFVSLFLSFNVFLITAYLILTIMIGSFAFVIFKNRKKIKEKFKNFNDLQDAENKINDEIQSIISLLSFEQLEYLVSKNYYESNYLKSKTEYYLNNFIAKKLKLENGEYSLLKIAKELTNNKVVIKNL